MRGGFKIDLIIAALIVSAAVHVGVMMWARPKVMTHVAHGVAHVVRRGAMMVKRADVRDEPVKFEIVKDLPAQKEAPEVEDSVAVPLPSEASPVPSVSMPVPATMEMPKILERLRPEADAPAIPSADAVVGATPPPDALAAMPMEISVPVSDLVTAGGTVAVGPVLATVNAPTFAPPPIVPPDAPVVEEPEKMTSADKSDEASDGKKGEDGKDAFKPIEDVMPEVDEKVVAQEKAAVRDLINDDSAAELAGAVDVSMDTCAAADGYTYFRAVVTPKADLKPVPKDIVVLIDASGSIGSDRLTSCRKAARSILRTCTNTGDRFNLVAFRDRFSYAFRNWRECDAESFAAGDKWLQRLAAHGRTDVFASISSVLTLPRDPARPLIALVVTDGDANAGVKGTAEIISRFSALNDGLVSVYMYGVKASANRELIDVLTRGNRGESFIFDGWRWNAGAGIEALSERFRDPLITDMRVIFPAACQAEAYPSLLRNVYRGNDVEIVGRVRGAPDEISFSLKGLSGATAYEGFFRLPVARGAADQSLPAAWVKERDIDLKLR